MLETAQNGATVTTGASSSLPGWLGYALAGAVGLGVGIAIGRATIR